MRVLLPGLRRTDVGNCPTGLRGILASCFTPVRRVASLTNHGGQRWTVALDVQSQRFVFTPSAVWSGSKSTARGEPTVQPSHEDAFEPTPPPAAEPPRRATG